jgi:hypothetical protein
MDPPQNWLTGDAERDVLESPETHSQSTVSGVFAVNFNSGRRSAAHDGRERST